MVSPNIVFQSYFQILIMKDWGPIEKEQFLQEQSEESTSSLSAIKSHDPALILCMLYH